MTKLDNREPQKTSRQRDVYKLSEMLTRPLFRLIYLFLRRSRPIFYFNFERYIITPKKYKKLYKRVIHMCLLHPKKILLYEFI